MHAQGEFDFHSPAPLPESEVNRLIHHLKANPGFHTAKELSRELELTDREIRNIAQQSDGQIISGPGSPGYCHILHCPAEQIAHIADTLRSQARLMLARSIRIRKQAHRLIR